MTFLLIIAKDLTFVIGLSHEEASKAMKAALDHGANFWNAVSEFACTFFKTLFSCLLCTLPLGTRNQEHLIAYIPRHNRLLSTAPQTPILFNY